MSLSETLWGLTFQPIMTAIAAVQQTVNQILQKVNKMADVLDSEIAAQAAMTSDLATLMTDVQALIADMSSAGIQPTDARWATLTSAINAATGTITTLDASVKAALPPATTTPPPGA